MTFERLVAIAEKVGTCPEAMEIRPEKINADTDVNREKTKLGLEVKTYLEKMEVRH
jgi:hypothetical protein